jgi:hypothetical protein
LLGIFLKVSEFKETAMTVLAVGPAMEEMDYARKVLIGDILVIRHLGQYVA